MRIDKFLWYVRIYKTRSIATDQIKKNRVTMNGNPLKSSKEVLIGEVFDIRKDQINYTIEIINIPKNRLGAKLVSLYIKDLTSEQQLDLLKNNNLSQSYYRQKGLGRPTKKDRRDIDDFIDNADKREN